MKTALFPLSREFAKDVVRATWLGLIGQGPPISPTTFSWLTFRGDTADIVIQDVDETELEKPAKCRRNARASLENISRAMRTRLSDGPRP